MEDYYQSLGTYFEDKDYVEKEVNSQLYKETKIRIVIIGINEPVEEIRPVYKILKLEYVGDNSGYKKIIDEINLYLRTNGKTNGYKNDNNHWGIFYLLKELITAFQVQGFNYFRGQRCSWETVPSIFRNLVNSDEKLFYTRFEYLYKTISQEFPDEIEYYEQSTESIEKRSDQLAILQHYGLPTSLLDITENPYIAMLFMFSSGDVYIPQLEMYKIDLQNHVEKSIVSFVHKNGKNKRIKAQRGAFLNYDKLKNFVQLKKEKFLIKDEYLPIEKVVISLEVSKEKTIEYLNEEEAKITEDSENPSIEIKNSSSNEMSQKNLTNLKNSFSKDETIKSFYAYIQKQLTRKLSEYNYFSSELYPDFSDYISYKAQEFKKNEKNNTLNKIDISKLS
ncbi:MAG: FRG domain-containing protein [Lactococcus cremoris]